MIQAFLQRIIDANPEYLDSMTVDEWRSVIDEAKALVGTVPAWQSIETAPKDGTLILLYSPRGQVVGYWEERWKVDFEFIDWEGSAWSTIYNPTHWQPLPAPPEVQS